MSASHPSHPSASHPSTETMSCLTGMVASTAPRPTTTDAASAAFAQIDAELARAGMSWEDLRLVQIELEPEVRGVASWTALAGG